MKLYNIKYRVIERVWLDTEGNKSSNFFITWQLLLFGFIPLMPFFPWTEMVGLETYDFIWFDSEEKAVEFLDNHKKGYGSVISQKKVWED